MTKLKTLCIGCGSTKHTKKAMLDGKYGDYCSNCINAVKRLHHPGSAQYKRDRDRDAHELDLLQPWDAKGNPSKEFITHYPDEANDIFSQEELEQYG
jgi:hypothetical protein